MTLRTALLLWTLSVCAVAMAEATAGAPHVIMFPPLGKQGPAAILPANDEIVSNRAQSRRPMVRASVALRSVATRLRSLVAPSGGGATNHGTGNLLMSPLSAAAALGQMLLGAQGETRGLLADLLGAPGSGSSGPGRVPDLDYHQQFKALLELLVADEGVDRGVDGVELRLASAFFAQKGLPLRVDFQHALHDLYHADVRQLDFRERPAVAQAAVNAWARHATRGRIPTVLASPLPPSAAALVASAVYFRGAWEWPFDSDLSVNGWFRMSPRKRVAVKYMRSHFSGMRYVENTSLGYRLVVLPYKDGKTAMYVILPDKKDADLTTFSMQMSLDQMMDVARTAQPHTVTLVLPRMSISGSFSLKEPLSKLQGMRRLPRSVPVKLQEPEFESRNKISETFNLSRVSQSGSKSHSRESVPQTRDIYLSYKNRVKRDVEAENIRYNWSHSRIARNAPEPRSQDSQFPPIQLTVGMHSPQVSFRPAVHQPPVASSDKSDEAKNNHHSLGMVVGETQSMEEPSPENKPMVLGVPLTIIDADDSNILSKIPSEYSSQTIDQSSGKTLQHSMRGMEIPYPYRPLPGQELKPPFDKPPKLITIKDILPKIVVGTSVSFPEQSNESIPEGSKLTMRPSGLTISKKQRERGENTAVRSVDVMENDDLDSEGTASPGASLDNRNTSNQLPTQSLEPTPKTEESQNGTRVSLPISVSENSKENSSESVELEASVNDTEATSTVPPPVPIIVFTSHVEDIGINPVISSSSHIEDINSQSENSTSSTSSSNRETLTSTESVNNTHLVDCFDSASTNVPSPSPTQPTSTSLMPSNVSHLTLTDFPDIEMIGDVLNPLSVGSQGVYTVRPQPANNAAFDDVVLDLTGASTDKRLRVSDALHHVWLEVTETGTEAAAVTTTIVDYTGDNKVLKVDRPFLLAIVHEPTEALLFLAAVSDPSGGAGVRADIPQKNGVSAAAG